MGAPIIIDDDTGGTGPHLTTAGGALHIRDPLFPSGTARRLLGLTGGATEQELAGVSITSFQVRNADGSLRASFEGVQKVVVTSMLGRSVTVTVDGSNVAFDVSESMTVTYGDYGMADLAGDALSIIDVYHPGLTHYTDAGMVCFWL